MRALAMTSVGSWVMQVAQQPNFMRRGHFICEVVCSRYQSICIRVQSFSFIDNGLYKFSYLDYALRKSQRQSLKSRGRYLWIKDARC